MDTERADAAVGWDTTTSEQWRKRVDDVPWQADGPDWYKSLDCPRCAHGITVHKRSGPSLDGRQVVAECDCSSAHTGRPEEELAGCGQRAWITAPSARGGTGA